MYTINISKLNGFSGTGFFGEDFSSIEDLKAIFRKYAVDPTAVYKLSFSLSSIKKSMIANGNEQARKNGNVDLFTVFAEASRNPFKDIVIFYCRCGWIDEHGLCKFILDDTKELKPQYGKKLSTILREIGMEI